MVLEVTGICLSQEVSTLTNASSPAIVAEIHTCK